MSNSKTFKIHTLGCKVNQYDSRDLQNRLLSYGFKSKDKDADVVVVNTCAVTRTAIKKDKRIISKLRKENPNAKLVVRGCWPQAYPQEAEKLHADLVRGTGSIKELSQEIIKIIGVEEIPAYQEEMLTSEDRSRYFIKIQDGCQQFCSYCVIPYTRGKLKSRPASEVKREIKTAAKQGFEEIVLTGIHLGLYGAEKKGGKGLTSLLKELIQIKGVGRIRLSSIEITEVNEELIELLSSSEKICPHLHIPLQSGSDKILKAMNRPYTSSFFREKVEYIRSRVPNIALTTDVMVGFPGETKELFEETVDFIKEINFSRLHVFPFSAHEGTPAAQLPGRVDREEIKERTSLLRDLSEDMEKGFKEKFKGEWVHPVVERVEENKGEGRTEYYFKAIFKADGLKGERDDIIGKVVKIEM